MQVSSTQYSKLLFFAPNFSHFYRRSPKSVCHFFIGTPNRTILYWKTTLGNMTFLLCILRTFCILCRSECSRTSRPLWRLRRSALWRRSHLSVLPLPFPRLEFRYSIQIRITTLYLTQRSHCRLLLSSLRSIIRTVHIRHRCIVLCGTVELTAREISVQSSDLILHLILNANVRRLVSH